MNDDVLLELDSKSINNSKSGAQGQKVYVTKPHLKIKQSVLSPKMLESTDY